MNAVQSTRRGSLKRVLRIAVCTATTLLAIAILVRAGVVASQTEGGWQILGEHITAGLPPWFESRKQPADALSYGNLWLHEQAIEVEADPTATAAECMGAALLLQSKPTSGHFNLSPRIRDVGRAMWMQPPRIPIDENQFDMQPTYRALGRMLVEKAIRLEPEQKDWLRLRGMLGLSSYAENLRAAEMDPENSLHEYLLGIASFEAAVIRELNARFVLSDVEMYAAARQHYAAALGKKTFMVGEQSAGSMATFLERASGPLHFKLFCAKPEFSWMPLHTLGQITTQVHQWSSGKFQLNTDEEQEIHAWFKAHSASAQFLPQVLAGDESWKYEATMLRGNRNPAWQRFFAVRNAWWQADSKKSRSFESEKVWSFIAIAGSSAMWALLIVALPSYLLACKIRLRASPSGELRGSFAKSIGIWLVALAITFGEFGVLLSFQPTFGRHHSYLAWIALAVFAAAVISILVLAARVVLQQRKLPAAQRSAVYHGGRLTLVVVGAFLLLAPLCYAVDPKVRSAIAVVWVKFPRNVLQQFRSDIPLGAKGETWSDAIAQWGLHGGLFLTTAVWIAMMAFLFWRRSASRSTTTSTSSAERSTWRANFGGAALHVAKSAVPVAALMFLLSIAAATQWSIAIQSEYDRQFARLANPRWMAEEIEAEAQRLQIPLPVAEALEQNSSPASGEELQP